ncbi:MAG TPA: 2-oxoacid:acceptor oxidoreductase family protein, partial [Solirubrobacteraceae bacterium]|nr:2-oxoacid:acceptor oxidoreductase family protein [Solirubrobacteraceae bacterium]
SFGSERMGAPVVAFCRIDERPIRLREPIFEPDAIVVQDPTLLHHVDVFGGLVPGGYVLINSAREIAELGLEELHERTAPERVVTVAASEIARRHTGRPIPNATLLGALARLTACVSLEALERAIEQRLRGAAAAGNVAAARDAWASLPEEVASAGH